jgi:hypothetical protein
VSEFSNSSLRGRVEIIELDLDKIIDLSAGTTYLKWDYKNQR